ncbi:TPA: hypothetical protein isoform 2 [Bos taurus]|nr:TPA: hypothetical protein isoform 2 [Bos taurus]
MRCTVCRTLVAIVTSPQTNMWPRSRHSTRCTSAASSVLRMSSSGYPSTLRVPHLGAVRFPGEGGEDAAKHPALLGVLHLVAVEMVELGAAAAEHQGHGGGLQPCGHHCGLRAPPSPPGGPSSGDTSHWLPSLRPTAHLFLQKPPLSTLLASRRGMFSQRSPRSQEVVTSLWRDGQW